MVLSVGSFNWLKHEEGSFMHLLVAGEISDAQVEKIRELYRAANNDVLRGEVIRLNHEQAENIGNFYRVSSPLPARSPQSSAAVMRELIRAAVDKVVHFDPLPALYDRQSLQWLSERRGEKGGAVSFLSELRTAFAPDILLDRDGKVYVTMNGELDSLNPLGEL